jgi:hypothetical protein
MSLLEVLIALAVLSIGLAGLAIMHLNAQKYVHSSYERSLASSIALDLEERLWLEVAEMAADNDPTTVGCPALLTSEGALYELEQHWKNGITRSDDDQTIPIVIPRLRVAVPNVARTVGIGTEGAGPFYREIDLLMTWGLSDEDEDFVRFNFGENSGQSFSYTARIYCSAKYPSGS